MKTVIDNVPETDGDIRRLILETIVAVRDGGLEVPQAAVMMAGFKELNASLNTSLNAAKLSIMMGNEGKNYVKRVRIGQQLIADNGVTE